MIRRVEHLLNLLWLAVVSGLFAAAVVCGRKGMLRCSLPVALGATVLLAVVLFPALSMTDDLQRAKMDTETSGRHLSNGFLLGAPEDHAALPATLIPFLLLLMLFGSRCWRSELLARLRVRLHAACPDVLQNVAPRPPPAMLPA